MFGSSKWSGCKKHPNHKQSPGVCFLCLSEKLSRLSDTGYALAANPACSDDVDLSSSLSSSDISSCESSPMSPPVGPSYYPSRFLRRHILLSETTAAGYASHCHEIKNKGKPMFWSKLLNIICPKIKEDRTTMIEYQADHVIISRSQPLMMYVE